jgi:arginyl-tRNA--protein-N-Asp/Glu arginylyltransferase
VTCGEGAKRCYAEAVGRTVGTSGEAAHAGLTQLLSRAMERRDLPLDGPFPCPYLPRRSARHLTVIPAPVFPGVYHALMDLNFRRLGPVFYRTRCEGCDQCRMLRVPVAEFSPSRAQRRCRARNADVEAVLAPSSPSADKLTLYRRYLEARHDGQMDGSELELRTLAGGSAVDTREIEYRVGGRLVAVGVADLEPQAMSAVYCYFDPDQSRRSLGVFNVLWMLDECRRRGLPWLYLGYWIAGSPRMSYKAGYRPCEALGADGTWSRVSASPASSAVSS